MKSPRWLFAGALLLAMAPSLALAATFPVTNTSNTGAGSLRQAIADSNGTPGSNSITFNIPGAGVQTISPATALPAITQPVVIDGYTQSGASANTNGSGLGLNGTLLIELDCTRCRFSTRCTRVRIVAHRGQIGEAGGV